MHQSTSASLWRDRFDLRAYGGAPCLIILAALDAFIKEHEEIGRNLPLLRQAATLEERLCLLEVSLHAVQHAILHMSKVQTMQTRVESKKLEMQQERDELDEILRIFREARVVGKA